MSDIPHSAHGYWIEPGGAINPLEKSMGHSEWIRDSGRFPGMGAEEAMEAAIASGWIGVSVSPVGQSVGVRVRPGSAEKQAARALGRIFKADGFLDREVYTDFARWSGRDLQNHLVRTGFNPDIFPDVASDIRFTEQQIIERQEEVALAEALAAAKREGNPPDHQRLRDLSSMIWEISNQTYSHIVRISPVGQGIEAVDALRDYCRQQIEVFDRFRMDLQVPIAELPFALSGSEIPVIACEPDHLAKVDWSLPELEVLQHLKEIDLALATRIFSGRADGHASPPEHWTALRIIEKIETGCGVLVTSKLDLLEKALAAPDPKKEDLELAARYYIGHELARTFSVCGGMYSKELKDALDMLPRNGHRKP